MDFGKLLDMLPQWTYTAAMEQNNTVIQLIFSELHEQGRSQRWLARKIQDRFGGSTGAWEVRLSEWKQGRRVMPADIADEACRQLGLSDSVRELLLPLLLESSKSLPEKVPA